MSRLHLTKLTEDGSSSPVQEDTQDTRYIFYSPSQTGNQWYKTWVDFLHTLNKKSRFLTFYTSERFTTLTTCDRLQCKLSTLTFNTLNLLLLETWVLSQNGNGPAQNQQQTLIKLAIHSSTSKDKQAVRLCYLWYTVYLALSCRNSANERKSLD